MTGDAGYFGLHNVLSLFKNKCDVIVYDNVMNSVIESAVTPFEVSPRRVGDLPAFGANQNKVNQQLNRQAKRRFMQKMTDIWRWQSNNPNGYLV